MRVQVFCDDRFHPAATVRRGLAPLAEAGPWEFDWVESAAAWEPGTLAQFPVVLLAKSNAISSIDWHPWLAGGKETAFRDYVSEGGGLVVVHSGCASYAEVAPMREVAGGTFVRHPPPCDVAIEPVVENVLTRGVASPFMVFDEHYFVTLDDAGADVFLHSRSSHGVQPAGWTRRSGKGRVCVLTPGHNLPVWLHPSFQVLLQNALRWAARA